MLRNILLSLVFILGIVIIDFQTVVFALMTYFIGIGIIIFTNKDNLKYILKIYNISFIVYFSYLLICYIFMAHHNYQYLLAYDPINVYIPTTEFYLAQGNFFNMLTSIWHEHVFLSRNTPGYYTVLTLFGCISSALNANLYVSLQLSTLLFTCFISVVIFRLLLLTNISQTRSYKYAIIISLFSIIFFYSTQILRDVHIALFYLLAILITFTPKFSIVNIVKLLLLIIVTALFRIESGLFLFILIPIYLLLTLQKSKYKIIVATISLGIFIVLAIFAINNREEISTIYENNRENYVEGVTEGRGMIANLQKIPVIGDFFSIIYNAIQPLPFWAKMSPSGKDNLGNEVYNIMTFPLVFASFFNWITILYILMWIFSPEIKNRTRQQISKPLQYNLWVGLVFLYLQSSVIAQRRLMGYYCIFYILFFIIYSNLKIEEKKQFNILAILSFVFMQVISVIYLS